MNFLRMVSTKDPLKPILKMGKLKAKENMKMMSDKGNGFSTTIMDKSVRLVRMIGANQPDFGNTFILPVFAIIRLSEVQEN